MRASYSVDPEWYVYRKDRAYLLSDWNFTVDGTDFWIPALIYDIDGASIPWVFRSIPFIGKPFDKANLTGAGAHDPLFLTHVLGFSGANEVAYQLWRQSGKTKLGASAMHAAISSPFGRVAYYNTQADTEELQKVRNAIKQRPDWQKFESMWFTKRPYEQVFT